VAEEQEIPQKNSSDDADGHREAKSKEKALTEKSGAPKTSATNPQQPGTISHHEPQPATMEVHKHPHDVMHRKKWPEYLLEFLMIFLAVFLGFLAENFREHQVDKERGKQYTRMLAEDLAVDTITFSTVQQRVNAMISNLDSSIKIIQYERYSDEESVANLYRFNLAGLSGFAFSLADRASTQLKNAGGMRLISKMNVADSLLSYWTIGDLIKELQSEFGQIREKAREQSYSIFDQRYYSDEVINGRREVIGHPTLLTKDKKFLIEFTNRLSHLRNALRDVYINAIRRAAGKAKRLIFLIRKEYGLK